MKTPDTILNTIADEITYLEAQLYVHHYSATEEDYEIKDGEKVYTEEFLSEMPSDYATMLGRYGTLVEIKNLIQNSHAQETHEDFSLFPSENNPRFQISFDE